MEKMETARRRRRVSRDDNDRVPSTASSVGCAIFVVLTSRCWQGGDALERERGGGQGGRAHGTFSACFPIFSFFFSPPRKMIDAGVRLNAIEPPSPLKFPTHLGVRLNAIEPPSSLNSQPTCSASIILRPLIRGRSPPRSRCSRSRARPRARSCGTCDYRGATRR